MFNNDLVIITQRHLVRKNCRACTVGTRQVKEYSIFFFDKYIEYNTARCQGNQNVYHKQVNVSFTNSIT